MVVALVLDDPDGQQSVKCKYLVARAREKKNSIFDYVHLSSSLLRKVKYGQSLKKAVQTNERFDDVEAESEIETISLPRQLPKAPWVHSGSNATVPMTASCRRADPAKQSSNQSLARMDEATANIQFGRLIRLQSLDGGWLGIDEDGSLRKLSRIHDGDARSFLTLFPKQNRHGSSRLGRVKSGDEVLLVWGAATISTSHKVVQANSTGLRNPPSQLLDEVQRHKAACEQDGRCCFTNFQVGEDSSHWWTLHRPVAGSAKPGLQHSYLKNGELVQITQSGLTLHYERERTLKRKFKPVTSAATWNIPDSTGCDSGATSHSCLGSKSTDDTSNTDTHIGTSRIWLQQNPYTAQSKLDGRRKRWDNAWIVVDVTDVRDRRQKVTPSNRQRSFSAETTRLTECSNGCNDKKYVSEARDNSSTEKTTPTQTDAKKVDEGDGVGSNDNDDGMDSEEEEDDDDDDDDDGVPTKKELIRMRDRLERANTRVSVLNARLAISRVEGAQRRAAAIIVRFLRRVCKAEVRKRAQLLIESRIRRREKRGPIDGILEMSTDQQLRVLQCYKPNIYGSQRNHDPLNRRIQGISLHGSRYVENERRRMESIQRDLKFLGHQQFQQQRSIASVSRLPASNPSGRSASSSLYGKPYVAQDRERERRLHVELAMIPKGQPPFRFGKGCRPHTAPSATC